MMRKVVETLLVSLVVVMVLGAYFKFVGGIPFNVNQTSTQKMGTFDVTGNGKKSVSPDEAVVNVGVRKQARTVKEAQKLANTTMGQLSAELVKIGVDEKDIRTENYSVNPEYSQDDYQKVSGFSVFANVEVRVRESNFDMIEQVMDLAGVLGLEQMNGLRFELSDKLEKETKNAARALAVDEAKEKAESLAKLAGVKLGKIVNVNESFGGGVVPMYARAESMMLKTADIGVPTQVNPGTTDVSVDVTLSYETL